MTNATWSTLEPPNTKVAILMAMALPDHAPLATVRNRLSEAVDQVEREHGRVVITKHGRPAAVLISVDDLASLEETLEILGDRTVLGELREAVQSDHAALTRDEALGLISRR